MTTTVVLTPPADGSRASVTVAPGRTYSCPAGATITVPAFDAPLPEANGWTVATNVAVTSAASYSASGALAVPTAAASPASAVISAASAVSMTLAAGGTNPVSLKVANLGAGAATITPNGTTFHGGAKTSVVLPGSASGGGSAVFEWQPGVGTSGTWLVTVSA